MDQVVLLSCVTACIAYTISETVLFQSIRLKAGTRCSWLGKLLSCGYCCGHWVAFVLVAIYRPRIYHHVWPLDYFLTALLIAWIAAFQWAALTWLVQKLGK